MRLFLDLYILLKPGSQYDVSLALRPLCCDKILKTDWSNAMQLTQNQIKSDPILRYVASDGVKRSASSSQYNALTQRKETQGLTSYCEPASNHF